MEQSGTENDYYYYTNENAFQNLSSFEKREFGDFSCNGEMVFVSYDAKNRLDRVEIVKGNILTKNGNPIVEAERQLSDMSISFDNSIMKVSSSAETLEELGNVTVDAGRTVEKVMYNNSPVTFSQYGDTVVIGSIPLSSTRQSSIQAAASRILHCRIFTSAISSPMAAIHTPLPSRFRRGPKSGLLTAGTGDLR